MAEIPTWSEFKRDLEEQNINWTVKSNHAGIPVVEFQFPDSAPSADDLICKRCRQTAILGKESEEFPFRTTGVIVRLANLSVAKVPNCSDSMIFTKIGEDTLEDERVWAEVNSCLNDSYRLTPGAQLIGGGPLSYGLTVSHVMLELRRKKIGEGRIRPDVSVIQDALR